MLAPPRVLSRKALGRRAPVSWSAGNDPERDARRDRDRKRDDDDRAVHTDVLQPRNVGRLRGHERARRHERNRQAQHRTRRPQDDGFGEQLTEQPDAAGTERRSDRQLRLTRGGARQEQVGDIRAGDQQHEANGAEKHEERRSHVAHDHVGERHGVERQRVVGLTERHLQLTADSPQVVIDLRERDARLGTADDRQELTAPALRGRRAEGVVVNERRIHIRVVEQPGAGREHADDLDRRAADPDPAAEHTAIAAELALPEPIVEHGHPFVPWLSCRPATDLGRARRPHPGSRRDRSLTLVPRTSRGSPASSIV